MFFKRLAHVCIHARDLDRSLAYYHKLGFKDRFTFTRKGKTYGKYLELAEKTYIEIFHEPDHGPLVNNGLVHFCLETEDLDGLIKYLDKEGVAHTPKSQGCDFTWQIWLEDPDGNKFEVHEYSEQSLQKHGGTVEATW